MSSYYEIPVYGKRLIAIGPEPTGTDVPFERVRPGDSKERKHRSKLNNNYYGGEMN